MKLPPTNWRKPKWIASFQTFLSTLKSQPKPVYKLVTSQDCINKYGSPNVQMEYKWMVLLDIPDWINKEIPALPNKVYCNKDFVTPFLKALTNIVDRGLQDEIKSWDGCFNIRNIRGGKTWSLHSWGIAIDINAAWNGLGKEPQISPALVACFTDAGFYWGGNFSRKDGMHFQLATIL